MGQSRRVEDDKIHSFPCHSLEERSKAKEVENYQYTSVPMGKRLKLSFAQLFLLISSVFTEQSQICVKNTNPAMLEQGDESTITFDR